MKKYLNIVILILVGLIILPSEMDAQYGKKKKRRTTDDIETESRTERGSSNIMNRLWFGVNIGNPYVSSRVLNLGVGPMAGYKFNNYLSAGVISDFSYTYVWNQGVSNENYLDYSVGVFGRARFLRSFYAHLEYNYTSLDRATTIEPRSSFPVMFVGGGYTSGRPPWGFEATLLFDVLGNLQQFRIPFVYRIGVTYNF